MARDPELTELAVHLGQAVKDRPVRRDRLGLRPELIRKSIHIASIAVPIAVWVLPPPIPIALLIAATTAAILIEYGRAKIRWVRHVFLTRTRRLLRGHERDGVAGATWMAVAYLGAYLLFPLPVAVAAMLYNGLGDAMAAIVGKRWGRHRLTNGKSWEGAGAAGLTNVVVGLAVPGIGLVPAIVGGVGAALLEILPTHIDDNLRVTLGGGLLLFLATLLLGA